MQQDVLQDGRQKHLLPARTPLAFDVAGGELQRALPGKLFLMLTLPFLAQHMESRIQPVLTASLPLPHSTEETLPSPQQCTCPSFCNLKLFIKILPLSEKPFYLKKSMFINFSRKNDLFHHIPRYPNNFYRWSIL